MAWTNEQYEKAKKLAEEGLSASEIGIHLGKTRNAVLGKLHRNGIEKRVRKENRCERRKRKPKRQSRPFVLFHQMGLIDKNSPVRRAHLVEDGYVPKPEEPAPEGQRKTVETLEENSCRWPIGDPQKADFHFCGAEAHVGSVYCPAHHARAYVTPVLKQRVSEQEVVRETEDA
jgi:GcrA cell cycle regulator